MAMIQRRCFDCNFWQKSTNEAGQCRRSAPNAVLFNGAGAQSHGTAWPATSADDWCGEFSRIEDR